MIMSISIDNQQGSAAHTKSTTASRTAKILPHEGLDLPSCAGSNNNAEQLSISPVIAQPQPERGDEVVSAAASTAPAAALYSTAKGGAMLVEEGPGAAKEDAAADGKGGTALAAVATIATLAATAAVTVPVATGMLSSFLLYGGFLIGVYFAFTVVAGWIKDQISEAVCSAASSVKAVVWDRPARFMHGVFRPDTFYDVLVDNPIDIAMTTLSAVIPNFVYVSRQAGNPTISRKYPCVGTKCSNESQEESFFFNYSSNSSNSSNSFAHSVGVNPFHHPYAAALVHLAAALVIIAIVWFVLLHVLWKPLDYLARKVARTAEKWMWPIDNSSIVQQLEPPFVINLGQIIFFLVATIISGIFSERMKKWCCEQLTSAWAAFWRRYGGTRTAGIMLASIVKKDKEGDARLALETAHLSLNREIAVTEQDELKVATTAAGVLFKRMKPMLNNVAGDYIKVRLYRGADGPELGSSRDTPFLMSLAELRADTAPVKFTLFAYDEKEGARSAHSLMIDRAELALCSIVDTDGIQLWTSQHPWCSKGSEMPAAQKKKQYGRGQTAKGAGAGDGVIPPGQWANGCWMRGIVLIMHEAACFLMESAVPMTREAARFTSYPWSCDNGCEALRPLFEGKLNPREGTIIVVTEPQSVGDLLPLVFDFVLAENVTHDNVFFDKIRVKDLLVFNEDVAMWDEETPARAIVQFSAPKSDTSGPGHWRPVQKCIAGFWDHEEARLLEVSELKPRLFVAASFVLDRKERMRLQQREVEEGQRLYPSTLKKKPQPAVAAEPQPAVAAAAAAAAAKTEEQQESLQQVTTPPPVPDSMRMAQQTMMEGLPPPEAPRPPPPLYMAKPKSEVSITRAALRDKKLGAALKKVQGRFPMVPEKRQLELLMSNFCRRSGEVQLERAESTLQREQEALEREQSRKPAVAERHQLSANASAFVPLVPAAEQQKPKVAQRSSLVAAFSGEQPSAAASATARGGAPQDDDVSPLPRPPTGALLLVPATPSSSQQLQQVAGSHVSPSQDQGKKRSVASIQMPQPVSQRQPAQVAALGAPAPAAAVKVAPPAPVPHKKQMSAKALAPAAVAAPAKAPAPAVPATWVAALGAPAPAPATARAAAPLAPPSAVGAAVVAGRATRQLVPLQERAAAPPKHSWNKFAFENLCDKQRCEEFGCGRERAHHPKGRGCMDSSVCSGCSRVALYECGALLAAAAKTFTCKACLQKRRGELAQREEEAKAERQQLDKEKTKKKKHDDDERRKAKADAAAVEAQLARDAKIERERQDKEAAEALKERRAAEEQAAAAADGTLRPEQAAAVPPENRRILQAAAAAANRQQRQPRVVRGVPAAKPQRATSAPANRVGPQKRLDAAGEALVFQLAPGEAQGPPLLSSLAGRLFCNLVLEFQDLGSKTANQAQPETQERHLQALKMMKAEMTLADKLLPLGHAVAAVYERRAETRKWQPQTTERELACAIGAFQNLPRYANVRSGYKLTEDKVFSSVMKIWKHRANAAQPINQVAATALDVARAVELCKDPSVKAALIMAWCFAGRVADVSHLKGVDVLKMSMETGELQVRFCTTKTTQSAGVQPYTLTSCVPPEWRAAIQAQLADYNRRCQGSDNGLFSLSIKKLAARVTESLRRVNPALGARTLRRGALQILAKEGNCDLEEVRKFAGHKNEATTLRYLSWGAGAKKQQTRSFEAAAVLGKGVEELRKIEERKKAAAAAVAEDAKRNAGAVLAPPDVLEDSA